jgi:methionyl-tRNA synthetase
MPKKFYITTTLPYVNSDPHIGFAAEIIRADIIARYRRILGDEVFFNTGTDEHGMKIYRKAEEEGIEPQAYVDRFAAKFAQLEDVLNLTFNSFTRTTDPHHIKAAEEFWRFCKANGDIYKKNYQVKYCVGCELEKNDSELENGCCPLHPNQKIELIDEENYFFAFSKYQEKLLKLYEKNPDFVLPRHRLHEVKNFVESGLQDFSISRLKAKMPWGIPVPDDEDHVMYVWFDALINYISCLGWPDNEKEFKKFWPGLQVAGKDNLRQQAAMWQAMLMSAGLPNSTQILIFGFIQSGGQKMSKSLGNVINPFEVVSKYGVDPTRYYIAAGLQAYEDSDFTFESFEKKYNADLANGLGNLVARTLAMAEKYFAGKVPDVGKRPEKFDFKKDWQLYDSLMDEYKFGEAIEVAWGIIRTADSYINQNKPWELAKAGDTDSLAGVIYNPMEIIRHIAWMIAPFMPETSDKILEQLGFDVLKEKEKPFAELRKWGLLPKGQQIKKGEVLFPRLA